AGASRAVSHPSGARRRGFPPQHAALHHGLSGASVRYLMGIVIARSEATKQSIPPLAVRWIASRSLSSGAHSRDPLARNDGKGRYDEQEAIETARRRARSVHHAV